MISMMDLVKRGSRNKYDRARNMLNPVTLGMFVVFSFLSDGDFQFYGPDLVVTVSGIRSQSWSRKGARCPCNLWRIGRNNNLQTKMSGIGENPQSAHVEKNIKSG